MFVNTLNSVVNSKVFVICKRWSYSPWATHAVARGRLHGKNGRRHKTPNTELCKCKRAVGVFSQLCRTDLLVVLEIVCCALILSTGLGFKCDWRIETVEIQVCGCDTLMVLTRKLSHDTCLLVNCECPYLSGYCRCIFARKWNCSIVSTLWTYDHMITQHTHTHTHKNTHAHVDRHVCILAVLLFVCVLCWYTRP